MNGKWNPYEGIENPDNFSSQQDVDVYRSGALAKSVEHAAFIKDRFPGLSSISDACCGNGRLLISLAKDIERLSGYDIAQSRISFAQTWVMDCGLKNVTIWQDDLLQPSAKVTDNKSQLVTCITGAFGYFEALCSGNGKQVIKTLAETITPDGHLLLELYQYPIVKQRCQQAHDRIYRTWAELPDTDPFRYYLSQYELDCDKPMLRHQKRFVARTGAFDDGREEALYIYSESDIRTLLSSHFDNIETYSDWAGSPYREGQDDVLILVAHLKS